MKILKRIVFQEFLIKKNSYDDRSVVARKVLNVVHEVEIELCRGAFLCKGTFVNTLGEHETEKLIAYL